MFRYQHPIILASQSPVRKMLMESAGLEFQTTPSELDEDALKPSIADLPIREQAAYLAREKAKDVSARYPEALILAADQIGELHGKPLFKPGNTENNVRVLQDMSGQPHQQHTATCFYLDNQRLWQHVETSTLHMRELTDEHIKAYVAADQPFNASGGIRFEGLGKHLFSHIEGDVDSILGLPMLKILNWLQDSKLISPKAP